MAKLTAKQEKFCTEFVQFGNAAEAYRRAYSAENMKPETVWSKASRLLRGEGVREKVRNMQQLAARRAQMTLEGHLEELRRLRDMAVEEGQLSAAITAEVNRGKAAGLYADRVRADLHGEVRVVLFGGE